MLSSLLANPFSHALDDPRLDAILKGVSRSFYLSLAVLPPAVRTQLSVAYLVARAADTIADTEVISREERSALLEELAGAIVNKTKADATTKRIRDAALGKSKVEKENALIQSLDLCLTVLHGFDPYDVLATERVLETLLAGMQKDLQRFDGPLFALQTLTELDEHCYAAAGCVGEYWTQITHHHHESLLGVDLLEQSARGIRLGKALQYVNVLRDTPRDLLDGRCYLPRQLLSTFSLTPETLLGASTRKRGKDAVRYLIDVALNHFDAGFDYIEHIPARDRRLRLPVILPLWIGLETLRALQNADDPFDPNAPVKISRERVYRMMLEASLGLVSESVLFELHRLRREALRA